MWKLRGSGSGPEVGVQVSFLIPMLMLILSADATTHGYRGIKLRGFLLKLETLVGGRRAFLSRSKKTVSSGSLSFTGAAGT